MQSPNLQSNNTYTASFAPNPSAANQPQQGANSQNNPVPPLQSAADLSTGPSAKNLQTYSTITTPQGSTDPWTMPEYQPIQLAELGTEKLADEAANTKKVERFLKHAQEYEADGDFKDAEKTYKKALKYTENAEHYKLYAGCLREIYRNLSQMPLTPGKDEAKERVYKEKATRAFYYLGDLYQKQGALQDAQAAYQAACDLALYTAPLQALVDVARQLGQKVSLATALEKLADFYIDKGDIALAIQMLKEAVQVETSFKRLQKLDLLCGKNGGAAGQSKVDQRDILRFELQIQTLEQKVIKQKAKIGTLKEHIKTLGEKVEFSDRRVIDLDLSTWPNVEDQHLIPLIKNNPGIQSLNLSGCSKISDASIASLKSLHWLTSLNLQGCYQLTDAGLQHLAGLTQLRELNLYSCTKLTDAGLKHLARLTQLNALDLYGCSNITDVGLQHLAGLTQLTNLNLSDCQKFTAAGLQHLVGLSQLRELKLRGCQQINDVGLGYLSGLTQLRELQLNNCTQLTDAGLKHLSGLTQLTLLKLCKCAQLTDAGLKHLAGLTQLTWLDLEGCSKISDAGLQTLSGLTQLTLLDLEDCRQISDVGLQTLSGLTQLTLLDLGGCLRITDAVLQHLSGLTQLRKLQLNCTRITSNTKEQLKNQIPGLTIIE